MADDTNTKPGEVRPEDIQSNNAEVKAKLEAQDINGQSGAGSDDIFAGTSEALDKLRETVVKKEDEAPVVDDVKPAADAKKTDDTGTPPAPDDAAKKAEEEAAAKKAADEAAANEKAKADEIFKDVHLPPGARPKSAEAFGAIKAKAAQEIAARDEEIEKLKKTVEEHAAKLKDPVPAEVQTELKELREFRAKFDIEADPKFRAYDETADRAREFIYDQLSKNPNLDPEAIEKIKKLGGPDKVKMDLIFAAMKDPLAERLISARLGEIEQAKFDKAQAQKAAKANVGKYIEERTQQFESARTAHNSATKKELDSIMGKLTWLHPVTTDAKATKEQKAEAEAHNKFVAEMNAQLAEAMNNDTPNMRATMLAGMAQLFYLQDKHAAQSAVLRRTVEELKETKEKLAKFTGASVARLGNSAAAPGPAKVAEKETDIFNTRASDSLDAIRDRVIAERSRANAG